MQKNKEGRTPLYLACRYGKESIIDLYLEKYQLDMGEKDNLSQTICMALVLSGGSHILDKYGNYLPWLDCSVTINPTVLVPLHLHVL